jgi:tetratricopeptide (TPR) repeat protein
MRALVVVILLARVAQADPKADARAHVVEADTHFKLGRFTEALAEYTKAYEIFPAPPLLFNIGQCHRNLKNWERAAFFFEGFLRERPDAPNRAVVEDLLKEARDQAEAARVAAAKQAEDEAAKKRLDLEAEQRRVTAEQEARRDEQHRRDAQPIAKAEPHVPVYKKWWFWAAVGSGALAAGGTAYYLSGSTSEVPPNGSLGGLDRR